MANIEPPIVDLSNFDARRGEITQQLMDAATSIGTPFSAGSVCMAQLKDKATTSDGLCRIQASCMSRGMASSRNSSTLHSRSQQGLLPP